jgi:hypothetical protein
MGSKKGSMIELHTAFSGLFRSDTRVWVAIERLRADNLDFSALQLQREVERLFPIKNQCSFEV